jgi:acetyl esterase/lipase
MKRWHRALIGLLVLLGLVESALAGPLLDRLRERRAGNGAVGSEALPAGVQRLENLAYGSDPAQRLDVYLPPDARHAPVILMVHGGAWVIGDKAMGRVVDAKVARWASRGFIFVSINYRMLPAAAPDVQLQDVARALAFAQVRAAEWGGDAQRFVLMGHSAGAHLVALLAANPGAAQLSGLQPVLGTVALDSAAMNLGEIMSQKHYRLYDKPFGDDPVYWQRMSPTLNLRAGAAPFLAVCSSRRDESSRQARQFAERAGSLGIRAQVLSQDLSHGEINSQLGLPGAYTAAVENFLAGLDGELARRLQ